MKEGLFCVTCMVDNGCTYERYETYVWAPTVTSAKALAMNYWLRKGNDNVVKVESARHASDKGVVCTKHIPRTLKAR